MRAAIGFGLLCLLAQGSASAAPEPRPFSSGGRMGFYWEAFFNAERSTAGGTDWKATVLVVNNTGEADRSTYRVDCADGNAQVTDETNETFRIDPAASPPMPEKLLHDLWLGICRNASGEASTRKSLDHRRKPVNLGGLGRVSIVADPDTAPAGNFVKLAIGAGREPERAVVYCSPTVPTVYWPATEAMVQISDLASEISQKGALAERSNTFWKRICRPMQKGAGSRG